MRMCTGNINSLICDLFHGSYHLRIKCMSTFVCVTKKHAFLRSIPHANHHLFPSMHYLLLSLSNWYVPVEVLHVISHLSYIAKTSLFLVLNSVNIRGILYLANPSHFVDNHRKSNSAPKMPVHPKCYIFRDRNIRKYCLMPKLPPSVWFPSLYN